ncbi:NRDE family protein [Marinospirillum alkaliphilum]|uniref:Uncharacterized conserved protein, contains NRDE domain n=1 Tax=Marinospirillum alkaliphilum DSM 21637 TaxID=1122209 RepID=A0A1K1W0F2_9GAMM|nr:NRDE family protein [Marinospirillum alkaliphilum]SFX30894.1 Uncharacterized conserved protein, contains NRDE domain [Marinospirillum alkaliphilum DSM 21637]
MCLLALCWQHHPDYPLLLAANRDEFHQRPTRAANHWPEHPGLMGGKDLQAGGSWLLANQQGHWAALTNVRNGRELAQAQPAASRGELVLKAVQQQPAAMADWLIQHGKNYAGFNLLWGNKNQAWYFSNRLAQTPQALPPGLYLLSNATLDVSWPKTRRLKQGINHWLQQPDCHPLQLFDTLTDQVQAPDHELPDTAIGLERERFLSPVFITGEHYGTRASTLLWQNSKGQWFLHERNHQHNQKQVNERQFTWQG